MLYDRCFQRVECYIVARTWTTGVEDLMSSVFMWTLEKFHSFHDLSRQSAQESTKFLIR